MPQQPYGQQQAANPYAAPQQQLYDAYNNALNARNGYYNLANTLNNQAYQQQQAQLPQFPQQPAYYPQQPAAPVVQQSYNMPPFSGLPQQPAGYNPWASMIPQQAQQPFFPPPVNPYGLPGEGFPPATPQLPGGQAGYPNFPGPESLVPPPPPPAPDASPVAPPPPPPQEIPPAPQEPPPPPPQPMQQQQPQAIQPQPMQQQPPVDQAQQPQQPQQPTIQQLPVEDLNAILMSPFPEDYPLKEQAMQEIAMRGFGTPETYQALIQQATKDTSQLTGQQWDEETLLAQEALWTLGMMNRIQGTPAVQSGTMKVNELPGVSEIKNILTSKTADDALRAAAVQSLQAMGEPVLADKDIKNILKKVTKNKNINQDVRDLANRALKGETIPHPMEAGMGAPMGAPGMGAPMGAPMGADPMAGLPPELLAALGGGPANAPMGAPSQANAPMGMPMGPMGGPGQGQAPPMMGPGGDNQGLPPDLAALLGLGGPAAGAPAPQGQGARPPMMLMA